VNPHGFTVERLVGIVVLIAGRRARRGDADCLQSGDLSFPQSDVRSFLSYHQVVYVRLMSLSENTDAPWRVGVLFSQTGVTSAVEQSQLNATLLAIEEINSSGGVLDRMVEPVIYDPASDPKQFRSLAERLFQVDRIRLLFACYMSSTRKAVLPVVESHRGLLFYPTLYEGIRGTAFTPVLRRTRTRCSSQNSCCRLTAIASCWWDRTTSILTNPIV